MRYAREGQGRALLGDPTIMVGMADTLKKMGKKRVGVIYQGDTYGKGGENHMRMNLGTSRKLIQLALDNIANATKNPVGTAMMP